MRSLPTNGSLQLREVRIRVGECQYHPRNRIHSLIGSRLHLENIVSQHSGVIRLARVLRTVRTPSLDLPVPQPAIDQQRELPASVRDSA